MEKFTNNQNPEIQEKIETPKSVVEEVYTEGTEEKAEQIEKVGEKIKIIIGKKPKRKN